MNKGTWKKSLIVCHMEYGRWLTDHKMILLLLPMVFLKSTVIDGFYRMSRAVGAGFHILEPFIAMWNSQGYSLLLICFYLLMLGDYLKGNGLLKQIIYYAGRKKWIGGQLLFLAASSGSYMLFWLVSSVLVSFPQGYFGTLWSRLVMEYALLFPERAESMEAQLITGKLFRQLPPLEGFLHSFFLNWIYLFLLGEVLLLFYVLHIRKAGLAAAFLIVGAGTGASLMAGRIKWFFPAAHAGLSQHFTDYFREELFSLKASYLAGVIAILLLAVLICFLAKGIRFSDMEDERNA